MRRLYRSQPQIEGVSELRKHLEDEGWFVRVTRWSQGWQVGAYWPSFPARFGAHSTWRATEDEAWQELESPIARLRSEPDFPGPRG